MLPSCNAMKKAKAKPNFGNDNMEKRYIVTSQNKDTIHD